MIETSRKYSTVWSSTFEAYEQAFRKIVSDIFGYSGSRKHQTVGGTGRREWKNEVEAFELSSITPELIQQWKLCRIREAERKGRY